MKGKNFDEYYDVNTFISNYSKLYILYSELSKYIETDDIIMIVISKIDILDEENDDKLEEGLPNDLWGIGSIFKLSLMEKRSVATFHRLVNSYFDLEEKIRNRKIN